VPLDEDREHTTYDAAAVTDYLIAAAARWDSSLGEYLLDWDDARVADDPHATALAFARFAYRHGCTVCDCDAVLAASGEGQPPPVS
jgi:hypothetical protein